MLETLGTMLLFARNAEAENKKILIWGAGQGGLKTFELLEHYGVEIHAFLDSSLEKIGASLKRLPILSPEILNTDPSWNHSCCAVLIASIAYVPISKQLETTGWHEGNDYFIVTQNILNHNFFPLLSDLRLDIAKYRSCFQIERFHLIFNGRIDTGAKCLTWCCEPIHNRPGVALCGTAEESVKSFARERAEIIAESVKFSLLDSQHADEERKFTSGCAKCVNFQPGDLSDLGESDGLIHYINLSMYPAPCQSRCIYCDVYSSERGIFNERLHSESYEKVFDIIDSVQKNDMIATDVVWQVSSGEITIHPYKDRIFNLVKDNAAVFYTNCFTFDEKIAGNLVVNPLSAINLSIDSGTPETWHKIKGVNNFDTVTDNLTKYFKSSARPGQITLKYIILPGINDNLEDYLSLIEIMKDLNVSHLAIACDCKYKYPFDGEQRKSLVKTAGYLAAILYKNCMTMSMDANTYSPREGENAVTYAKELLKSGKV